MHYNLIIITKLEIDCSFLKNFNYLIVEDAIINSEKSITIKNQQITYDFLIIDKLYNNLKTLKEDKKIITNQFFETSIASVFAIGSINNSKKPLNEQIKTIIEYLENPF